MCSKGFGTYVPFFKIYMQKILNGLVNPIKQIYIGKIKKIFEIIIKNFKKG